MNATAMSGDKKVRANPGWGKAVAVGAACALAGFAVGAASNEQRMIVTPYAQAQFVPVDPARPGVAQLAVLWGNPATGPSAMWLKFGRNAGRLHTHSSDYHLMLFKGTMQHWAQGERAQETRELGPGSYWFQPGGQPHADACLSDECVMFIHWAGKRDARPYQTQT